MGTPLGTTILISVVVVLLAVGTVRWATANKRRKKAAQWVGSTAIQVRGLIERDIDEGHWQSMLDDYSGTVGQVVLDHHRRVHSRVDEIIDGDFFIAAVKGSLADIPAIGQGQWRTEFEVMASARLSNLLDIVTLQHQVNGLMQHAGNQLSSRWTPANNGPPADLGAVSPERLRSLIGLPNDLGNSFIREGIFDAAALGGTILGALSLGTSANILGGCLAVLDNSWFQGFVADLILDYVIEEVGEEVIEEVAEAVVALFTGIGAVYTIYKFGKYGWKFKKLFIDKEPLQKVRAQVREVLRLRFDELSEQLPQQIQHAMTAQKDLLLEEAIELEAHCNSLTPELAYA